MIIVVSEGFAIIILFIYACLFYLSAILFERKRLLNNKNYIISMLLPPIGIIISLISKEGNGKNNLSQILILIHLILAVILLVFVRSMDEIRAL